MNRAMQHLTKEEQVADFLREGIIAGRFARGARLKQQEEVSGPIPESRLPEELPEQSGSGA